MSLKTFVSTLDLLYRTSHTDRCGMLGELVTDLVDPIGHLWLGLRVTGYGLRVTGYGLRVMGYGLRVRLTRVHGLRVRIDGWLGLGLLGLRGRGVIHGEGCDANGQG